MISGLHHLSRLPPHLPQAEARPPQRLVLHGFALLSLRCRNSPDTASGNVASQLSVHLLILCTSKALHSTVGGSKIERSNTKRIQIPNLQTGPKA